MSSDAAPTERPHDQPRLTSRPQPSRRGVLAWSLASCGLLLASGALRLVSTRTVRASDREPLAPFPLDSLPRSLNGWTVVPNSEKQLDKLTTRITGSTSHLIRTYYDEMTGTALSVLILYGPAEPVLPHTPQVCYPASGYHSVGSQGDRTVVIDDHLSAVFRTDLFAKSGGRSVVRQSVYHSYRLDGVWSPTITDRSLPRRYAGIFKVQIQRQILDGERTEGGDEPIEAFLRQLLPVIERQLAAAPPKPAQS